MPTDNEMVDLAERCERAEGPDCGLDAAIVRVAYERRWPSLCGYDGPINYDPALWIQRYGGDFTASLDAALSLVPVGIFEEVATGSGTKRSFAQLIYPAYGLGKWPQRRQSIYVRAATPALALCAAALRARSLTK